MVTYFQISLCSVTCDKSQKFRQVSAVHELSAQLLWIPRDKAQDRTVASNECRLPRKHAFMRLSTNFGKSIPTTAYQTFLFVIHSCYVAHSLSVGLVPSLVPRPCVFVACSMKFTQRAWARSSRDVCCSLHHGHFTENQ